MKHSKLKKTILIIVMTIVLFVALIIVFISPIAKYLIEKYDTKYLGREIKIGWLYLNPFTAYIHIANLKVYEANSDSLFLTADGLSADFQMLKVFSKTYEINTISLDKPVGYIIQNGKQLNFSDLIQRFTPKEKRDTSIPRVPVHFNILNMKVTDGEFHYIEQNFPINYFIKNVNIESPGKWWDNDSLNIKFALQSGVGAGDIKGNGCIYFDSTRYRIATTITKFDLGLLNQYLKDLSNYGHLAAILDAEIQATGSLKDQLDMDGKAFVAVSKFHFGKKEGDDFAAFDNLVIDAKQINPKNFKYFIDSIMIAHPFFVYERYDELNNIERMFGKNGSRIKQGQAASDAGRFNLIIEIAKYVKVIAKNFLKSYYKVNKVAVYNGDVKFNDYSLREKFTIEASPLFIIADSIDKNHKQFYASLNTAVKPYGNIAVHLSLNPNNYGYFNLDYKISKVPVSLFNPYLISYTSFPLDRGSLDFNGTMNVVDSIITSENHLLIVDPRVAKRVKKKDTKWIPIPFLMALVRSTGNAIDYNIPIRGDLNDPKFKIWGAIWQVVGNIFIKPPSVGYLYHVSQVEQQVEKSLTLKFQMRQSSLRPNQEKFIKEMATFLKENPTAVLTVTPMQYVEKEKEHILLFEAKKKFFLQSHQLKSMTEKDSILIDKMSVKDSFFMRYLQQKMSNKDVFTLQEKCDILIGKDLVANRFRQLMQNRATEFKSYFGDLVSRIHFKTEQNTIPFNGFSYYKIQYEGQIPESLLEAYQELQDLNEEAPRGKYKDKRKVKTVR